VACPQQATNVVGSEGLLGMLRALRVRRQSGQNIVELAFAIPVMLMLALGMLDFGRVFYTYVGITNGARAGAREATRQAEKTPSPECNMDWVRDKVKNEQFGLFNNPLTGSPFLPIALNTMIKIGYLDATNTFVEVTSCPFPPNIDRRTVYIDAYPFQPFSFFVANWLGGCTTPTGPLMTSTCGTIPLSTWATLPVMK
jgi:Flp pilus assembly protein TadG